MLYCEYIDICKLLYNRMASFACHMAWLHDEGVMYVQYSTSTFCMKTCECHFMRMTNVLKVFNINPMI